MITESPSARAVPLPVKVEHGVALVARRLGEARSRNPAGSCSRSAARAPVLQRGRLCPPSESGPGPARLLADRRTREVGRTRTASPVVIDVTVFELRMLTAL
jgi:hypothetical protein